ncbi:ketoacyl-synt-domain-containing protein [Hypoxylon sp. FL0543]|nr:ketoacyl-synt-domain-containing protein [Hypoxylon sp. FL0543]
MENSAPDAMEPIAVVGIGCRFPGNATSPSDLWHMLSHGESAWSEIPKSRLNVASYFHPSGNRQGSIPFQAGHFLEGDVRAFDSSFFSIPADEARAIDPQQRILLEVAVEALDSAGIDRNAIKKSDTGVWVGSFVKDYEQIVLRDPDDSPKYGATGNGIAIMSNRISYFLDVNGPSMTIDTGCSASLVCVHNACQGLRNREIDIGLAGGAGLILTPNTMMPMTALNFLSPDGKCFAFDARANGYGRGEGIGIVVLKRLQDAIRDNDNIRGVIRGSSVNQDGRTPGITLPSSEAQLRNIKSVYKRAGLSVDKTAYVECHGTGTQAGDFRELKAISDGFCGQRTSANPIYVGSIKTNIGHLEGCAGIAGLIKGVLTIENGMIPKHLNFELPGNPAIKFDDWKVKVPITNTPWPTGGLRRASINCFGFGGTNAHVIMDDAAHYLAQRGLLAHHNTAIPDDDPDLSKPHPAATDTIIPNDAMRDTPLSAQGLRIPCRDSRTHLFVFSAHEQKVLSQMLKDYSAYVAKQVDAASGNIMEDLAYTLGCRRTKLQWTASVVAQSLEDLALKLGQLGSVDFTRASDEKATKVAFIFGGQGAQWFAMGRELLGFDIFLDSIMGATTYLQTQAGCSFSLLEELLKDEGSSRINEPEISQPATTSVQVALIDLLGSYFGITPSSVCGHSSGEIAAAYALGAISREDAWELAFHRGRCAAALLKPEDGGSPKGRMLAVGLSASEAQKFVDQIGSGRVVVACVNSPTSVTLSGDEDVIQKLQVIFQAEGIFNRLLVVNIAYHSHHMKRCEAAYLESIAHIRPRTPSHKAVPHPHIQGRLVTPEDVRLGTAHADIATDSNGPVMYSSVTGHPISWGELGPDYWVKNMVSPVLFAGAMHQMVKAIGNDKPNMILELSPHSTLQGPVKQILDAEEKLGQRPPYYSMLRRGQDAAMTSLEAVGKLWGHGCDISMPWVVMRNPQTRLPKLLVDVPKYPWNHDNVYWYESHLSRANRFQVHGRYDLIGRPTADSIPFQPRWRGFFRLSENPWIQDHQVQKTMIYPAAGMVTMVLEAAKQVAPEEFSGIEITQFRIDKAMIIPGTAHGLEYALNMNKRTTHQAVTSASNAESASMTTPSTTFEFCIYSKQLDRPWEEHGSGLVTIHRRRSVEGARATHQILRENLIQTARYYQTYLEAKNSCDELVIPRQLYETLDVIGMNYGPLFQNISSLHKGDDACVSVIRVPDTKSVMPANFEYPHIIHPATLDSIFQTAFAIGSEPMVPSFLGSLYVSAGCHTLSTSGEQLAVYSQANRRGLRDASSSFLVSDGSWLGTSGPRNHPLVVVKDMVFTALEPSVESGFLPNHRNLCSEIVWDNLDTSSNSDGKQEVVQIHGHSIGPTDDVLILIPEHERPALVELCAEFSGQLNCNFRTLRSISSIESLPEFCISLLDIDDQALVWSWTEQDFLALRNVITATKGIFWIARGSQLETANPRACLIQGLGRTIQSEYPNKKLVTFDVGTDTYFHSTSMESSVRTIVDLFRKSFFGPKTTKPIETEYVEREGRIMVPRLVPVKQLNSMIERGAALAEPILQPMPAPHERPLKCEIGETGNMGSLYWVDDPDASLPISPDDVKVRVIKTTLSDLDNDIARGRARNDSLGTNVYGVVEKVGRNVECVSVGDHVVGIARGALRDYVRCHCRLLYKVPDGELHLHCLHLLESFSIARYALGDLTAEDSILIYGGAGVFGQAAIQLAKSAGATIFANADTNEQRGVLSHFWKLPEDHILDARTEGYADEILCLTNGKGVDVIYDPEARSRGSNIRCVKEGGRVIGFANKPDKSMTINKAEVTGKTFSCTMIDIPQLIKHQPSRLGAALAFVTQMLISRYFEVWSHDNYHEHDFSDLAAAFMALEANKTSGPICCRRTVSKPVPILPEPARPTSNYLHEDATYILSGGLGGLGIEIAKLLVANGVKHIVFLSRSGARSEVAKSCLDILRNRGTEVQVYKVDICDGDALRKVSSEIQQSMPPVKGLFQCAAVLRDSVFENMTYEDWDSATRPKTFGSWNLYQIFSADVDFFVFLSSSAGVIGNRGQANYAAGNAFQDGLARHINTESNGATHAVSVDLGPILGAGMLAEDPRTLDILKASGFFGIRLQDFKRLIKCAITGYMENGQRMPAQVITGVGTGGLIRQNKPADPYWTRTAMFTRLNQEDMPESTAAGSGDDPDPQDAMRTKLSQAVDVEETSLIIREGLKVMLSKSINMNSSDVDVTRPPSAYGVDSLVAVGVRNWVSRECEADVSIFEVLSETSIEELSATIAQRRANQQ